MIYGRQIQLSFYIFAVCMVVLSISCSKIEPTSTTNTNTDNTNNGSTGPSIVSSNPSKPSATPAPIVTTPTTPTNPTTPTTPTPPAISNITINHIATSACPPNFEKITFTCSATNMPADASFEWYFGDNKSDTLSPSPIKTYVNAGTYEVLVKVKSKGAFVGTATKKVTAFGETFAPVPTADFNFFYPNSPRNGLYKYSFYANTQNTANTWEWSFGNDSTGTGEFIEHSYVQANQQLNYNVTLKAYNRYGCWSSKTKLLQVPGK